MSTATATSRFAPSVIDPRTVEFIDAWDSNPEEGERPAVAVLNHYRSLLAPEAKARGGLNVCTICGAGLRYVVLVEYTETGELFVVGEDCAQNLSLAAEIGVKVTALRAKAAVGRENMKAVERREALLAADADLSAAFALREESDFIADVYAKAGDKRGLTERQIEAVKRSAEKIRAAAKRRAERDAAEAALPSSPVIVGRVTITGEIVAEDYKPGYAYNSPDVRKIIVRDDRGFKVWGTCPASLTAAGANVGSRVTFTAAVKAGDRDETFGFFSRPVKADLVTAA